MNRSLVLAVVVALTGLFTVRASAEVRTETIEYEIGGVTLKGYIAYDDAKLEKMPGVLIAPEWWGVNEYPKTRARQLAALGYVAMAMDMFGDGKIAATAQDATELVTPLYKDRSLMRSRAIAAMQQLAGHPRVDSKRIAVIGYCFGGTVALELARSGAELRAAVSFHGGLSTPIPADALKIKAEVLVCCGADDPMVDTDERAAFKREMRNANVKYTFVEYGGALHGFTNPGATALGIAGVGYDERADIQSWGQMNELFARTLGKE